MHKKPIHPTWLSQNQPRSITFVTELLRLHFGCICDNSRPRLLQNHAFTFSPILLSRHKKPFHPTWLSRNPTKINSFSKQTFDTSFWMHLLQFPTKIAHKPWLHFFTNFATKAQIKSTKLGQTKTQPRSIPFATNRFTPYFAYICNTSPPRLLKNYDFTFSPILLLMHKKQIHPTWLSQNPTKINSFCKQTFHTSLCIHLWHFPTKIAKKPWLQFFTNFATKAQKANPPNLAKPKSNQDQFLLLPKFLHLILDAFVTIPDQDC